MRFSILLSNQQSANALLTHDLSSLQAANQALSQLVCTSLSFSTTQHTPMSFLLPAMMKQSSVIPVLFTFEDRLIRL